MNSFECRKFYDLWDAYRAKQLTQEEIDRVERHLAVCESCRETYTLITGVESRVRKAEVDPFIIRRIAVAAADKRRAKSQSRLKLKPAFVWAAAAAFALPLMLIVWLLLPTDETIVPPSSPRKQIIAAPAAPLHPSVRFETDGRRIIDLFAGTSLYISSDAVLETITLSTDEVRFRLNSGTIAVEIGGHRADFRFVIDTPSSELEARGTLFSISIDADGVETTQVLEGEVEVRGKYVPESEVLTAGQGLVSTAGVLGRRSATQRDIKKIRRLMTGYAPSTRITRTNPGDDKWLKTQTDRAEKAVKTGRLSEASTLVDEIYRTHPQTMNTKRLLAQLARAYRRAKRFNEARNIYLRILKVFPSSSLAADSLVALGQIEYRTLNRPGDALQRFETYLLHHSSGFLAETARAERIRVLQSMGRHRQIVSAADEYLRSHPRGFNSAEVTRRKADALAQMGRRAEARLIYQRVITEWPGSSESKRAQKKLDAIR